MNDEKKGLPVRKSGCCLKFIKRGLMNLYRKMALMIPRSITASDQINGRIFFIFREAFNGFFDKHKYSI